LDVTGIEFAIRERIGEPQDFIGRVEEMEYLYTWAGQVQRGISRSIAFLGRRKITENMVDEFVDKATHLHAARFPDKELRLGFFSKHGFEQKMESYLTQRGIVFTF
jgi:hypothetical protein